MDGVHFPSAAQAVAWTSAVASEVTSATLQKVAMVATQVATIVTKASAQEDIPLTDMNYTAKPQSHPFRGDLGCQNQSKHLLVDKEIPPSLDDSFNTIQDDEDKWEIVERTPPIRPNHPPTITHNPTHVHDLQYIDPSVLALDNDPLEEVPV